MARGPFELKGLPIDHTIDAPFELAKAIAHLPARGGARFDIVLNKVRIEFPKPVSIKDILWF
jgi:hypothetical protein